MKTIKLLITSLILISGSFAVASPLRPVKLDSPRATMKSYLEAMSDYNQGRERDDAELINRVSDAVRTLDLSEVPYLLREEEGRKTAILLKEVLDRAIVINFDKIPDNDEIKNWRLKDTEIVISKQTEGDREGLYLFSRETVKRIPLFYQRVKDLPFIDERYQGAGYKAPLYERLLPSWAQESFLGIQKWQWAALFILVLLGFILKVITQFAFQVLAKATEKKQDGLRHRIFSVLQRPSGFLAMSLLYYFCFLLLSFEGFLLTAGVNILQLFVSFSVVWCAYALTEVVTESFRRMADRTATELDDQLVPLVSKSLKVFVVVIGVLASIQNLGFNVMSLLAGLGLGGLAFALAAKDTAANLFGSIMIILDRPFKVGDWIVTSQGEGNVMEVGFRSTRVHTFYDSVISIPNSVLANEKIDNMGQRTFRRVKTTLGVTYDTPADKLNEFIEGIKKILLANDAVRKDYFHVVFNGYGDSSLDILLYFFLKVPDWTEELQQKQAVFVEIYQLAERLGVSFAFPSRSLYVEKGPTLKGMVDL